MKTRLLIGALLACCLLGPARVLADDPPSPAPVTSMRGGELQHAAAPRRVLDQSSAGCPVCPVRCEVHETAHERGPGDEGVPAARLVDLNRADEGALLDLPGIGPARARAILDYRASHGAFRSISQLLQIKGIGRSLLKQLRPLVTLSGAG